ncbi:MAG: hypothetical protein E4H01_01360 [Lysobacterales bacterium]|nr:MAG: hypothetical protein E4H01_01360 [Xanthomonadales bacterium]
MRIADPSEVRWSVFWSPRMGAGAVRLVLLPGTSSAVPHAGARHAPPHTHARGQDHAQAQYNLGFMYQNGRGVPQDYVQAHKWFNLASAHSSGSDFGRQPARARSRY